MGLPSSLCQRDTPSFAGREFGDGLRAAIAGTGMTSRAVAELLDWDEGKLSDLVNGKSGSTAAADRRHRGRVRWLSDSDISAPAARTPSTAAFDSKAPATHIELGATTWSRFLAAVKADH